MIASIPALPASFAKRTMTSVGAVSFANLIGLFLGGLLGCFLSPNPQELRLPIRETLVLVFDRPS